MSIPRKPQTYRLYNSATATPTLNATLPNIPMPSAQPVPPPPANINLPAAATQPATQQQTQATPQLPHIPQPKPAAKQAPVKPTQRQEVEPRGEWAGAWLFKTTGRKGDIPPAERGAYFIGGGSLWLWGAWLAQLVIQNAMPVFNKQTINVTGIVQTGNPLAFVASCVISGIFMLMELYIWKNGHSPVVIIFSFLVFGPDIYYNIISYMTLFEVKTLEFNTAGSIIMLAGVATAVLPEKLIVEAWKG